MKYISKGEWFDKGTEVVLVDDYRPQADFGLFRGMRTCTNPKAEAHPLGERYEDEEDCGFDEFEEVV